MLFAIQYAFSTTVIAFMDMIKIISNMMRLSVFYMQCLLITELYLDSISVDLLSSSYGSGTYRTLDYIHGCIHNIL